MTVCCPWSRAASRIAVRGASRIAVRGAVLAVGAIAGLSFPCQARAAIALAGIPQGIGTVASPEPKQANRDRVEQCNRLVEVLNRRTGLDNSLTPDQQPTARELSDLAARTTGLAGTIGTVPLGDRTLLQYRNNFATLYRDLGSAMAVIANAMGRATSISANTAEGRAEAERILEQVAQAERTLDAIPGREEQLVNGLNGYCAGR